MVYARSAGGYGRGAALEEGHEPSGLEIPRDEPRAELGMPRAKKRPRPKHICRPRSGSPVSWELHAGNEIPGAFCL